MAGGRHQIEVHAAISVDDHPNDMAPAGLRHDHVLELDAQF
jgi:hypothetical protein